MATKTLKDLKKDLGPVDKVLVWVSIGGPGLGGYIPVYKSHIRDVLDMYELSVPVSYGIEDNCLFLHFQER